MRSTSEFEWAVGADVERKAAQFKPARTPRPLVVTYNVSRDAGPPFSRQSEGEHGLKGFVEELKRLKDSGAIILGASFTPQTAVITVDAPKGL